MQPISEYPVHRVKRPVMYQRWNSLTFVHWPYQPQDVRRLLPSQLELDTFDGAGWIGLTPFLLSGLRVPLVPALPWISRFPEMNVRTYVRGPDGERGIWFFTLEADRLPAVLGARLSYGLPYRWANMRVRYHGESVEYTSKRHVGRGSAEILVLRNFALKAKERELFLTARFRLYTTIAGRLAFAQVEHPPWPLESASVLKLEQDVIENSGVPRPNGKPLVHFSSGTAVRVGRPRFIGE